MGRAPCCSKVGLNRGPWTPSEDALLTRFIQTHGDGHWRTLPQRAGLLRCGKSCRLRWMNYLNPNIKRGDITPDEDDLILRLHSLLGNRWSLIARRLPNRTDNEIKNHWNTHLRKRAAAGIRPPHPRRIPPAPHPVKERESAGSEGLMTKVYCPKPIRVGGHCVPASGTTGCSEGDSSGTDSCRALSSSSSSSGVSGAEQDPAWRDFLSSAVEMAGDGSGDVAWRSLMSEMVEGEDGGVYFSGGGAWGSECLLGGAVGEGEDGDGAWRKLVSSVVDGEEGALWFPDEGESFREWMQLLHGEEGR